MRRAARWLATGVVVILAACAQPAPTTIIRASEPALRTATAGEMGRVGQSLVGRTGADVEAALGPATRIRFDSGYEVWIYRYVDAAQPTNVRRPEGARGGPGGAEVDEALAELVLLLTPTGTVARTRVRSPSR